MTAFREVLTTPLYRECKLVATIDHPYTTPPLHSFDGHLRLYREYEDTAVVLNWDVSLPSDRRYRYDLTTDTGLIAKNRRLYHYSPDRAYNEQSFDPQPWTFLPECVRLASAAVESRLRLPRGAAAVLQKRADDMLKLAAGAYTDSCLPWEYTRNILAEFYERFGFSQLATFLHARYSSYFWSPWRTDWIPWCMANVAGPLSLEKLLVAGLFDRAPFRSEQTGSTVHIQDLALLAAEVAKGTVIASFDVFLWSLAVAGISHYGNDRGFFERLATTTADPRLAQLQRTRLWEDCKRFVQIAEDNAVSVSIDTEDHVTISAGPRNPSKLTRITSMGAFLVCLGDQASTLLDDYTRGGFETTTVRLTL